MKILILMIILITGLLSCSTDKNTNTETTSSGNNIQEITQTISGTTTNTQTQEIVSETGTITTTGEVILPVNEMTTQAEKELSDELNNILESIESTGSVK